MSKWHKALVPLLFEMVDNTNLAQINFAIECTLVTSIDALKDPHQARNIFIYKAQTSKF